MQSISTRRSVAAVPSQTVTCRQLYIIFIRATGLPAGQSSSETILAKRIGIIGGGVAGLTASLTAADHGAEVTLFEALPHLGGRAAGGPGFDTGRHLATSAYHDFLELTDRLGSTSALNLLPIAIGAASGRRRLYWHLAAPTSHRATPLLNLLTSSFLPLTDRGGAITALMRTLTSNPEETNDDTLTGNEDDDSILRSHDLTAAEHWKRTGWPRRLVERLGIPLVLGMMNAKPEQAASAPFITALRRIFSDRQRRAGWTRGDRESLITAPAGECLAGAGVKIMLRTAVRALHRSDGKWWIEPTGTTRFSFDAVVVTPPPWMLGFLKDCSEAVRLLSAADKVKANGIITLRSRFKTVDALPGPLAEEGEERAIWFAEPSPGGEVLVERVISALPPGTKPDLSTLKRDFLPRAEQMLGASDPAGEVTIRWYPRATPLLTPDTPRPLLRQGEGFYYAGDWSATGLPATLESAARAGKIAGRCAAE